MSIICWTVIHHAAAPAAHTGAHMAHILRHAVHPLVHRVVRTLHHAPAATASPRTWIELVCKTIPAAVAGGGLLVPLPANPPRPPEPPPAAVVPAPAPWPWFAPPSSSWPSNGSSEAVIRPAPEPSSAFLLLALESCHRAASRPPR